MLIYRNVDDMIGMSDWCIIIPIRDNNTLKVRVYMRNKKALKGTYQKRYTYYIDRNDLKEIYSYESLGLAYNKCIKYRKQRCKAFGQNDFEKGEYTIANVTNNVKRTIFRLVLSGIGTATFTFSVPNDFKLAFLVNLSLSMSEWFSAYN